MQVDIIAEARKQWLAKPHDSITLKQASSLCNLEPATLRRHIKSGALPATQDNNHPNKPWMVTVQALNDWYVERGY